MTDGDETEQAVAELRAADPTADRLGVEVVSAVRGRVVVSAVVDPVDTNFLAMGHGGLMFTLADIAMSYVSNAEQRSLATAASIEFLAALAPGDSVTATATVVDRRGRSCVVDAVVEARGETVALFRGRTLAVRDSRQSES